MTNENKPPEAPIEIKEGTIIKYPMKFTNGEKPTSKKYRERIEQVDYVVVNRDGELWAEYWVKQSEFKLPDQYQTK